MYSTKSASSSHICRYPSERHSSYDINTISSVSSQIKFPSNSNTINTSLISSNEQGSKRFSSLIINYTQFLKQCDSDKSKRIVSDKVK